MTPLEKQVQVNLSLCMQAQTGQAGHWEIHSGPVAIEKSGPAPGIGDISNHLGFGSGVVKSNGL